MLKLDAEMEVKGVQYTFSTIVWKYPSAGWCFVSMPKEMAKEIRANLRCLEEGWGRMKARAKIGSTEWESAIWFDTKHETYLLPLKAEVRKKERIEVGKEIEVVIWI